MAISITDDCISCGACISECPNDAISEGDNIYVIDPERCTECVGFADVEACQSVCPEECCLPDPTRIETEALLLERARRRSIRTGSFHRRCRGAHALRDSATGLRPPAGDFLPQAIGPRTVWD